MKILFLYKYHPLYDYDHYLHMDLAKAIQNTEGVELMPYGLDLEKGYPDFVTVPYNSVLTLEDIKRFFDFDVIIICTKSRMFKNYSPAYFSEEKREGPWLPRDFKFFDCPKVVLEEDYHYEQDDSWYKEMGISLILQRHYSNVARGNAREEIKHLWHPFSVDPEIFKPDNLVQRTNKICAAASLSGFFYVHRVKVCEILEKTGMIKNYKNEMKKGDYPLCLRSYTCHLNGSGIADITAAKIFEIMASGSVLFTNESDKYGLKYLFPEDCYCTYKEDYSDVEKKAFMILNDKDYVKYTTKKALKIILKKHTHKTRIKEMLDIIKREYKI